MQSRAQVDMNIAFCDGAVFPEVLTKAVPATLVSGTITIERVQPTPL